MSMILDALKRADRERRRQEVEPPSLHSDHRPEPPSKVQTGQSWRKTALIALALLALGTAIGLALSSLRGTENASGQNPTGAPAETMSERTTPSAADPRQTLSEDSEAPNDTRRRDPVPPRDQQTSPGAVANLYQSDQVPRQTPPSEVSRLYQQPEREPETSAQPRRVIPAPSSEPERVSLPEPRETATVRLNSLEGKQEQEQEQKQEQESVETASASIPEPAPTAETTPAPAPTPQPSGVISIRELPWAMQQKIPSINYQAHDFREGRNSTVTLNQKQHRAGEKVSPEIRVEQIEEDGVVLSYRGEKFKLKALNSWVNM